MVESHVCHGDKNKEKAFWGVVIEVLKWQWKWKELFSESSINLRPFSGRGVSHSGNYSTYSPSIYCTSACFFILIAVYFTPVSSRAMGKVNCSPGKWTQLWPHSPSTLRGGSRTTMNWGWVSKHEICFLQIIPIISSKPLLDKRQRHMRVTLAGFQSCSGGGLAPMACTEPLFRVDWYRSAFVYPFSKYL